MNMNSDLCIGLQRVILRVFFVGMQRKCRPKIFFIVTLLKYYDVRNIRFRISIFSTRYCLFLTHHYSLVSSNYICFLY